VDRLIFRVRAICAIVSSRLSRIAVAAASSSGVMTLGRPPWRPRARAALRPAALEDQLAFELGKRGEQVQLQAAGGGRGVDALAQGSERDLALLQSRDDVDQVAQAAPEAVQAPDDELVAGQQLLQAGVELRSGSDRPGPDVLVDAFAAGVLERVELEREVLRAGGDARVADQVTVAHGRTTWARVLSGR
jgi:hypothetical protein